MKPRTKQQLSQAKQLIESRRFDEAKALLVTIDHPTADSWLLRLNTIAPTETKSFTGKLVLTIVLLFCLFIPGLIALSIFATEAKRYPKAEGAQALIMLNRFVWGAFAVLLALMGLLIVYLLIISNF